ncbi:PIN domain-containing protein [Neorhizobium alkalisoli]|uniref:Putative nucleic acid-binding protein n=1 Tax=Neorhizobium alkalisoli TaxID=528178 RepID=A0A561R3S6_9HYPH|nr:PIN domain-containing protein [Neorhizobium alkalisoli]TWF57278.1 putative nucleic acid-binding protein [Neorhizobium alkalisoli]
MSASPFLDTNIFVYAFTEGERTAEAQDILRQPFATSVQAFNEFAHVMRRKAKRDWNEIQRSLAALLKAADEIVVIDLALNEKAFDLVRRYNFTFYDALMVAAALKADCDTYFSEDLHHGLVVDEKLTIVNPFR